MALYIGNDKYVPMIGNTRGKFMWGDGLPISYQRLEYFTNEVGSFIDTGITPADIKNKPTIITKFQMISNGDKDWFGTDNNNGMIVFNYSSKGNQNYVRFLSGSYAGWVYTSGHSRDDINTISMPKTIKLIKETYACIYVDGKLICSNPNVSELTSGLHIQIGRGRNGLDTSSNWYSFQIADGNVVKFNGVPCIRKADNVVGMYDFATKKFFTNQGTGDFVAGPVDN